MSQSENHLPRPLSRHQWSQWQDRVFYTSALRPEKNEIRLMTILPGQANEDIRIKLNVVSLDDKPYFEALSYVWGDPKVTEDIKLNGWIFPITTNLRAALQALRRTHEARVFWVDAICVNQRNVIERGSQVSLMVRIYSECMLCTVWLGEGTETIGRAFEILGWFASTEGHIYDLVLSESEQNSEYEGNTGFFVPLKGIFLFPWWSRTWTVQEVILPHTVTVKCGAYSISWDAILKAYDCILKHMRQCCNIYWKSLDNADHDALLTFLETIETLKTSGDKYHDDDTSFEIISIIASHRSRQSSDPRDKVYGFLGLCSPAARQTMRVDYDASLADCYASPVLYDFEYSRSLRALGLVLSTGSEGSKGGEGLPLPSWVPDWSTDVNVLLRRGNIFGYVDLYDAAAGTEVWSERRGERLSLRGYYRETVRYVGVSATVSRGSELLDTINKWLELWQEVCLPELPDKGSSNKSDRSPESMIPFTRTLLRDIFRSLKPVTSDQQMPERSGGIIHRTRRATAQDYKACGRWWDLAWKNRHRTDEPHLLAEDEGEDVITEGIMDTLHDTMPCSRFFITDRLSIGLGPPTTVVGDEVWIVCGGNLPLILRREESVRTADGDENGDSNQLEGYHRLVGPCYVDGIMDGEAAGNLERDAVDVHLV